LDLATVEDWGEEILPEGVGMKWKKMGQGEGKVKEKYLFQVPHPQLTSSPILYRSNIQGGVIENPIYCHAFRSKITPALQAKKVQCRRSLTDPSMWSALQGLNNLFFAFRALFLDALPKF